MPHPKNHMKLTGDTHPPEVEYDTLVDDEALDDDPATASAVRTARPALEGIRFDRAAQAAPASARQPAMPAWSETPALQGARAFTRTRPMATLGLTLVAGYALLKLFRH